MPGPASRWFYSSSPHVSAGDAAQMLLDSFAKKTIIRRQIFDANQLQKLSLTLGRRQLHGVDISDNPPAVGTPVPPGWHLVFFTPNGLESELGPDGTDRTFNATAPFTRRMWAGGRMKWPSAPENQGGVLRIGDEVEERTRLVAAAAKKSRKSGEMVLVDVEKEYWGPKGLCLVDQRSWVFRPEITSVPQTERSELVGRVSRAPSTVQDMPKKENVGLFRFSALTFNGHLIHYNEGWARNVEGHAGEVVHGPLNLINVLDYWRDIHGHGELSLPKEISYRATSPIYAGEEYSLKTANFHDADGGKNVKVIAEKAGTTCFSADIVA
ncbi:hypothetical protein SPI_07380 [Niveomyces insectorum RCEF 264]|uniref:Mesaconyl-C4 CoA hydratase n=1 Tax=Niveomyces insectorum RCEF 264 TaxID=1081102 RepID=A0A167PT64_9HYPO|nr:hypothetical protein SPI_07380 [Niveomyces insectorum RCEF 264]